MIAGCSIFTSLSGYSDAPDALDGSVDATSADGAQNDAPTEPGLDAADASDASVDAGPYCARTDAAFCEDFDNPFVLGRWSLSTVERAAHGVDGLASTSTPASLWATTEALLNGQNAQSYRTVKLPNRAREVSYAFDLRIDQRGKEVLVMAGAGLDDLGDGFSRTVEVVLGETTDFVEEAREGTPVANNTYADHLFGALIPLGTWTRVSVFVTREPGATYRIKAMLGGVVVVDVASTLWMNLPLGEAFLHAGAFYSRGPSPGWRIRIDNVTFDAK